MAMPPLFTRARVIGAVAVVGAGLLLFGGGTLLSGGGIPEAGTAEVVRGTHSDIIEIRGQVQPVKSIYVTAPYNAGELQILKLARNGDSVKAGDIVAEFDAVNLRRTIQEKQGELRTAVAERDQAEAQAAITTEERKAAVSKAEFDVTRAKLSLGEIGLISEIDAERARLVLADAEQRLAESQAALAFAEANVRADRDARERRIEKVEADLALAQRQVEALHVTAPTDGTVNIMPNSRSVNMLAGGPPQEFRAGDRAYPGAVILELPDLSSVFLTARIDEVDRGRLAEGQPANIRLDAIADRDYQATVSDISLLARVDFGGVWPPPKQFDLALEITNPDDRLRPGMSAAARITVDQIEDVLLVPAAAVFYEDGRTVVYRATRRSLAPVPIAIIRQGREQVAVSGDLAPGDRVSLTRPGAPAEEAQP